MLNCVTHVSGMKCHLCFKKHTARSGDFAGPVDVIDRLVLLLLS